MEGETPLAPCLPPAAPCLPPAAEAEDMEHLVEMLRVSSDQPRETHSTPAQLARGIACEEYKNETQLDGVIRLIEKDLSEPYSIFTYRYFINNWPSLCYLVCCLRATPRCTQP